MSKEKNSTKPKTTTNSAPAKQGRGRPRKADKTTVKVVTQDESQNKQVPANATFPKSVKPLAKAQAKRSPKKPAVDVARLESSLKEAIAAKTESEARVKTLEGDLKSEREAKRRLERTVERLQAIIAELKAKEKRSIWPWRRG